MIKNAKDGWCDFTLGGFSGTPSYITKVPTELLECFISALKTGRGMCFLDEEGEEFTLVITPFETYIIESKEKISVYLINIPVKKMAEELLQDIESDFVAWEEWTPGYEYMSEAEKKNQSETLKRLVTKLREQIEN